MVNENLQGLMGNVLHMDTSKSPVLQDSQSKANTEPVSHLSSSHTPLLSFFHLKNLQGEV